MALFPRLLPSLLIAAACAWSTATSADTLLEIYDLALQNDPVLKAAEANFRASREIEVQARSALLPQIGAQASYGESDLSTKSKYNFFSNPFDQELQGENKNYYLNLDQKIFDLSAWFSFKQGKELTKEAAARFAADQQDLIVRTVEAYVNVLRAMDNLKSSTAEEAAFQRQLEQTQQRFEVGLIAITDVHEARAAYDLSVVNRLTDQGNLGVSYEALSVLTGQEHANLWLLSEKFPVINPVPESRDQWVRMALDGNFQLRASEFASTAAREASQAAKSRHLPTVTGRITALDTKSDDDVKDNNAILESARSFSSYSYRDGNQFEINMNLPLYQGGSISSQRRESAERAIAAQETHTSVMREAIQATRSLHLAVTTDVQRVKARQQAIVSAQSALDATTAGYEVGTRNVVDVLNAQRILYNAIRDYANTRYDYVLRALKLRQLAGVLNPEDVKMLSQWLVAPPAATASAAPESGSP